MVAGSKRGRWGHQSDGVPVGGALDRLSHAAANALVGNDAAAATLSDGRRVTAALLVGADGASSASRQLAGIEARGWAYHQRAFVTHVRTEEPHRATAWQRFQENGPIAFLPLADGRSSIVWTTTPEHAQRLVEGSVEEVGAEVTTAVDGALGLSEWLKDSR